VERDGLDIRLWCDWKGRRDVERCTISAVLQPDEFGTGLSGLKQERAPISRTRAGGFGEVLADQFVLLPVVHLWRVSLC
jgi:hypothetical protein